MWFDEPSAHMVYSSEKLDDLHQCLIRLHLSLQLRAEFFPNKLLVIPRKLLIIFLQALVDSSEDVTSCLRCKLIGIAH